MAVSLLFTKQVGLRLVPTHDTEDCKPSRWQQQPYTRHRVRAERPGGLKPAGGEAPAGVSAAKLNSSNPQSRGSSQATHRTSFLRLIPLSSTSSPSCRPQLSTSSGHVIPFLLQAHTCAGSVAQLAQLRPVLLWKEVSGLGSPLQKEDAWPSGLLSSRVSRKPTWCLVGESSWLPAQYAQGSLGHPFTSGPQVA